MTDPIAARAALASDLARRAGQIALDYYRNRASLEIETKNGELDLVSIADRAVEDMIRGEIAAAFPDDAILGEEGGAAEGRSGLTWVIDPIDGTVPFLMGLPHWCVVITLIEGAETLFGVIDVPVTGEHFAARAGQGVTLDGVRLSLDPSKRIDQGLVAVGASERCGAAPIAGIIRRLMEAGGMYYRNGSGANMLACVAAGRLAGYIEPSMNPWDSLAGLLMIREAGGVTHPYPADARLGLAMGAAPGVWDALESIVSAEFPDGLPEVEYWS
ncbi:inositol monophosphatase [Roseibacterium sp. SDUM158016]|uniref:inositol monophosphatase family protein n=1 Tax=Roseicyclus sediminis TaxID=2980997 RepID=UPI0021CF7018|nr:inositol monophosphatase family protein [Roseibacterium sp. SDUM158016]MCU4651968.1 inositol monophosphatase [Roseibacterium sp. SDUM158016]